VPSRICKDCPCGKKVAGEGYSVRLQNLGQKCNLKGNFLKKRAVGQKSRKEKAGLMVASDADILGTYIDSA